MDILMSETCWAHNKWNKITSDIKLVFHSSTSHRLLHIVWNAKFHCRIRNSPQLVPVLSQINSVHVFTFYFLRSTCILSAILRSPGPCVTFCNMLIFIPHGGRLLNIFAAAFHAWRQSAPSQTWGRASSWWQCHVITLYIIRNWTFPYHLAYSTGCTCRFRKHVW